MSTRLFTPRFFVMCAYSFTVFISVFQLLPTAPYHVLELGGTTADAGLFLGCLTYSSAFSAPLTGHLGDRFGQRRVLMIVSAMSAIFSVGYALITNIPWLLTAVVLYGLFWSALLSASGAYMASTIPEQRRAEGISYWGLTSTLALAVAPTAGFWMYRHGWRALCVELVTLNLLMAIIAWRLPDDRQTQPSTSPRGERVPPLNRREWEASEPPERSAAGGPREGRREGVWRDEVPGREGVSGVQRRSASEGAGASEPPERSAAGGPREGRREGVWRDEVPQMIVDWRVLALSITMALMSFGYGALTSFSALFADQLHVTPRSMFLAIMAAAILIIRLALGRTLDELGHRRVLIRCLGVPAAGLLILAGAHGVAMFVAAALVFGLGFGLMYPAYTAYVLRHVQFSRRGAAFGAMLAAFDTGVGSGSSMVGWLIHRFGFRVAFVSAAGLALLSLPYFLIAERKLGFREKELSA